MNTTPLRPPRRCWLAALLLAPFVCTAPPTVEALDLQPGGPGSTPITIHGFASEGFLLSSEYNYLGKSSEGSFKFTEAGLNASFNPFPRTRIAGQVFTYDVGPAGEYDVVFDYGFAEYTFNDYLGLRLGRVRRPEGLYNDTQDVDIARSSVLLPQGVYNARWRDFYLALDGPELFGTIPLQQAGSLSYELYYGAVRPQLNGGLSLQKANLPPFTELVSFNVPMMTGGQLWWNAPVNGLKVGVALNELKDLTYRTVAGRTSIGSPFTQRYSIEYLLNAWTFQAEYRHSRVNYTNTGAGQPPSTRLIEPDGWFVGAAYRFNKYVEVGSYYNEYYADVHDRSGKLLPFPSDAAQKDTALTIRFDPAEHWTFKVEGHHINGTALLLDNNQNPVRRDNGWWMLALKATFSF